MQVKVGIRALPLTEMSYPEQSTSALCIPLNGKQGIKIVHCAIKVIYVIDRAR